jgi:hypothetical protein
METRSVVSSQLPASVYAGNGDSCTQKDLDIAEIIATIKAKHAEQKQGCFTLRISFELEGFRAVHNEPIHNFYI